MKHYNVVAAVVCHADKYLCMQKGKTLIIPAINGSFLVARLSLVKLLNRRWLVN